MKTLRKIDIVRLDLSTEDIAREEPLADVSFYLDITHISEISYDIAQLVHGRLRGHCCRTRVPHCVVFMLPKNHLSETQKKHRKYAGKKLHVFGVKNTSSTMSLLNVTVLGSNVNYSEIGP